LRSIRSIQNESAGDATSIAPPMTSAVETERFGRSIRSNSSERTGSNGSSPAKLPLRPGMHSKMTHQRAASND
jgi:hypothetical protein